MQQEAFMKTFVILAISIALFGCASTDTERDSLGYQGYGQRGETVSETLERLRNDPSVEIRVDRGWTIASSPTEHAIWSCTPSNHPAHPSYVQRVFTERDGAVYVSTNAQCGAEKSVCDQLMREFLELNERARESFQSQ